MAIARTHQKNKSVSDRLDMALVLLVAHSDVTKIADRSLEKYHPSCPCAQLHNAHSHVLACIAAWRWDHRGTDNNIVHACMSARAIYSVLTLLPHKAEGSQSRLTATTNVLADIHNDMQPYHRIMVA